MSKEDKRNQAIRGFFAACLTIPEMEDYLEEVSEDWMPSEQHREVLDWVNQWTAERAGTKQSFYSWIKSRFAGQELTENAKWAIGLTGLVEELAVGKRHFKTLKGMVRSDRLATEAGKLREELEKAENTEALEAFLKKVEETAFDHDALGPTWKDDLRAESDYMKWLQKGQDHFLKTGQELIEGKISTGWPTIDRLTGGMQPGRMIVIGARPAVGKSVALLEWALSVAKQGRQALFVCLEMTREQSICRVLANWSDTPLDHILKRTVEPEQFARICCALNSSMADTHERVRWTQSKNQSLRTIRQAAREQKKQGLDVLFVDYLQLVKADGGDTQQPMHVRIGNISRGLKLLALELDICVVVAAQLNRELDKGDAKPQLYHLKDSGSIEQDADQVILMERPELYDAHNKAGCVELFLRKNRHGPTGYVVCYHELKKCQMKELQPLDISEMKREWDAIGK